MGTSTKCFLSQVGCLSYNSNIADGMQEKTKEEFNQLNTVSINFVFPELKYPSDFQLCASCACLLKLAYLFKLRVIQAITNRESCKLRNETEKLIKTTKEEQSKKNIHSGIDLDLNKTDKSILNTFGQVSKCVIEGLMQDVSRNKSQNCDNLIDVPLPAPKENLHLNKSTKQSVPKNFVGNSDQKIDCIIEIVDNLVNLAPIPNKSSTATKILQDPPPTAPNPPIVLISNPLQHKQDPPSLQQFLPEELPPATTVQNTPIVSTVQNQLPRKRVKTTPLRPKSLGNQPTPSTPVLLKPQVQPQTQVSFIYPEVIQINIDNRDQVRKEFIWDPVRQLYICRNSPKPPQVYSQISQPPTLANFSKPKSDSRVGVQTPTAKEFIDVSQLTSNFIQPSHQTIKDYCKIVEKVSQYNPGPMFVIKSVESLNPEVLKEQERQKLVVEAAQIKNVMAPDPSFSKSQTFPQKFPQSNFGPSSGLVPLSGLCPTGGLDPLIGLRPTSGLELSSGLGPSSSFEPSSEPWKCFPNTGVQPSWVVVKKLPDFMSKNVTRIVVKSLQELCSTKTNLRFLCKYCACHFVSQRNLNLHCRQTHSEKGFECNTCGEVFMDKVAFKVHREQVHNVVSVGRPIRCKGCKANLRTITDKEEHKNCKGKIKTTLPTPKMTSKKEATKESSRMQKVPIKNLRAKLTCHKCNSKNKFRGLYNLKIHQLNCKA